MASRRGKVVHFIAPGAPLALVEQDVPDPAPGELLVRIDLAGICGTDVHRLSGDVRPPAEPVCFGHEGTGFVVAIGAGADRDRAGAHLALGDRVYWAPYTVCGVCHACRAGRSASSCETAVWPAPAAERNAAAFQEYATLKPGVPVYRIPERTPSAAVIAFGCAMPTAIGGFLRLGEVPEHVVVQGSGPVGLASVVLAKRAGARVVVIGDPPNRLAVARALGADEAIPLDQTTPEERRAHIRSVTGGRGPGAVIEAAGHISAFDEGLRLLAPYGRYVIMGLYSGSQTTPLNPVAINNRNLSVIGSRGFPVEALQETVAIATELGARYDFAGLVTHRYRLERLEEAIAAAGRGEAVKAVVEA